jgi:hypothetical protein
MQAVIGQVNIPCGCLKNDEKEKVCDGVFVDSLRIVVWSDDCHEQHWKSNEFNGSVHPDAPINRNDGQSSTIYKAHYLCLLGLTQLTPPQPLPANGEGRFAA